MSIYEVIAFISLLLALPKDKIRNSRALAYISIGTLIVIAAIRGLSVGTDTYSYCEDFKSANTVFYGRTSSSEPLFALYTFLCKQYLNYDWYMFITYGLIVCLFLWVAYKKSTIFPLSIFLFVACEFYLSSFNGMRQYLAAAFIFLSLYYLDNKSKWDTIIFFILAFAAFLIHNTSLVVLLLFILRKYESSVLLQFSLVIGSFIVGFFLSEWFWVHFQSLIPDAGRLGVYLEYTGGSRNLVSNLGANIMFLAVMYLSDKKTQSSIFYKAYFVSMIVFNLVGGMYLLTRLTDNLAVAQIVIIPMVLRQTKNDLFKYGFLALLLVYALSRFYIKGLSNPDILPYVVRPEIFGL